MREKLFLRKRATLEREAPFHAPDSDLSQIQEKSVHKSGYENRDFQIHPFSIYIILRLVEPISKSGDLISRRILVLNPRFEGHLLPRKGGFFPNSTLNIEDLKESGNNCLQFSDTGIGTSYGVVLLKEGSKVTRRIISGRLRLGAIVFWNQIWVRGWSDGIALGKLSSLPSSFYSCVLVYCFFSQVGATIVVQFSVSSFLYCFAVLARTSSVGTRNTFIEHLVSSKAEEADEIYATFCSSKRAEEAIDESESKKDPDYKLANQKIALKNLCRQNMISVDFYSLEFVVLLPEKIIIQNDNDNLLVTKTNFFSYERFGGWTSCVTYD